MKYLVLFFFSFLFVQMNTAQTRVCFESMDGSNIKGIELYYEVFFENGEVFQSEAIPEEKCFLLNIPNSSKLEKIILNPEKEITNNLCINNNDLIITRNFIFETSTIDLQTIARSIAIDINFSGTSSSMDLVIAAQYIEGVFENFEEGTPWVFYDKAYLQSINELNLLDLPSQPIDNTIIIATNKIPALIELVAIRIGDSSGNCR